MSSSSKIGVIISSAPNADLEASELALALAAFELDITLVFIGAGVLWLLPQEPRKAQGKSARKVLAALPMYGIETAFYQAEALAEYAIEAGQLPSFIAPKTHAELAALLASCQQCFTF